MRSAVEKMDVPTEGQRANGIVRYASDVCTTKTQRVIVRYAVGKMDVPTEGRRANGAHPPASAGGWVGIRQRNAEICGMRRDGGHNATRCVMTPRRARPTIARLFIYQRRAYLFMDRSSIIKNAESNGNPDKRGPAFGSAGIALQCRIRLWRDIDALRGVARTTITQCVIVRYAVGKMDVPTVGRRANGAQPPASAGGWVGTMQRDAEICGMRRDGGHNHNAMRRYTVYSGVALHDDGTTR